MAYALPAVCLDISSAEAQLGQVHATHSCYDTDGRTRVVNRPVRLELGRNGAVFFEAGRGRTEGTAVDGKFPSPAVPGGHRPTSIDDLRVIIL